MLIAFRLLQGVFAAIMIPQGFGIVRASSRRRDRRRPSGCSAPSSASAAVLGPILGGALVDGDLFGLGWRAIFLVNVPIGIVAFVGERELLPESRRRTRRRSTWSARSS